MTDTMNRTDVHGRYGAGSHVLEVRDLRVHYATPLGDVIAVNGVSLDLYEGETLGLVGESGCGKSTLAMSILRLVQPPGRIVSGQVRILGIDLVRLKDAELRQVREKYGEIGTLSDVDDARVNKLGRDRWERSAMGTEVTALESVVEKVMRSGLSYTRQQRLIGYLTMLAAGADVRMSKETAAEYRKQAKRIGVAIEPGSLQGDSPGFVARLDLEQGREVVGV